ncbi:conserved hypothetical protein [Nitrosococcus oceani ATCC 19707]|uniref:Transposase DDE domain-containing protein n=1 Tax=Nitrosococcus oceani (strain ATCC 19707 / BCRC 17464 / JCM 30415 / NCIMB 11848 / C-107) TaxID=323261 RepID=Q3J8I6_NITOC|nr:conserved hypothetical protein [Nitrosococcus oceani ATCC 19707]
MAAVIPPRKNRVGWRDDDKNLYKVRPPMEKAFRPLKRWRGRATRYAKNSASFLAAVPIGCSALWANIS